MTGRKGKAVPLRRITLAIDTSDASAKALAFVLTKFPPDRSTEEGARAPFHVSVLHVTKRQPLAPIAVRFTAPWIKSEGKMKDAARRLVDQTVQQWSRRGSRLNLSIKLGTQPKRL